MPAKGELGVNDLPPLSDAQSAPVAAVLPKEIIPKGARHDKLVNVARQLVPNVSNIDGLKIELRQFRDEQCEAPKTMPNSEIDGIAEWAWRCRLENRLYHDRQSAFSLHRKPLDLLRDKPAQEDALALYVRLTDQHGHTPGKTFPLCQKAMKKRGLTSLSKARFLAARRLLEEVGLLKMVGRHKAGVKMQSFALAMPSDVLENVRRLAP